MSHQSHKYQCVLSDVEVREDEIRVILQNLEVYVVNGLFLRRLITHFRILLLDNLGNGVQQPELSMDVRGLSEEIEKVCQATVVLRSEGVTEVHGLLLLLLRVLLGCVQDVDGLLKFLYVHL